MITKNDEYWFNFAMRTAELSHCQFRHGAVILCKRKPISLGCNVLKNRNLKRLVGNAPYNSRAEARRNRSDQIHAEVVAILKARTDLKGSCLYSARCRPNHLPGDSAPCESCSQIIALAGISCVVYWSENKLQKVFI